jgi:phenazine biosynthesis protein phzE
MRVLVVDNYDSFVYNLVQYLAQLGVDSTVLRNDAPELAEPADVLADAGGVLVSPGPSTPERAGHSIDVIRACAAIGRPVLGVCLGHQVLASVLGLPLIRRDSPYQGVARDVPLFGEVRRVGFYSSFTAVTGESTLSTAYGPVEIARDSADGTVHALRGPGFAGLQFHPESVLSRDGVAVLATLLPGVVITSPVAG